MNNSPPGLFELLSAISGDLKILGVAGLGGALFQTLITPKQYWKQRLVQGLAHFLCAVFLGGAFYELSGMSMLITDNTTGLLASGFICGATGEFIIGYIQRFFAKR